MTQPKRIAERIAAPFAGSQVDRDAGVIRGVKLCGVSSLNGRDYPPAAFRQAIGKYEGAPVYIDHAGERGVRDKLGWIAAARVDADGTPRGDFHALKTHPSFPAVFEAAERNPALFGFSHVALCKTATVAGRERIESIDAVESVDLVAEPATTAGLFESNRKGGRAVALTVKEYLDKLAPRLGVASLLKARRLTEDDGYAGAEMPGDSPDAATAEPESGLKAGFLAAGTAILEAAFDGDTDFDAALDKLDALFDAFADDDGGDAGDDAGERLEAVGDGSSNQKGQRAAMSAKDPAEHDEDGEVIGWRRRGSRKKGGRRRKKREAAESPAGTAAAAVREAIDACRKVGFKGFDADDLDLIASAAPDRREAVARRLMGAGGGRAGEERPTSRTQTRESVGAGAAGGKAGEFHDGWQD